MSLLQKFSRERLIRVTRTLLQGPPWSARMVRQLLSGKCGVEIGGPSDVFRKRFFMPIYDCVAGLDNCDFSQQTKWATHTPEYCFDKTKSCGRTYFCEGSELTPVADGSYDFLLSSHNLEHFANPLKALREWQRVVRPGGHFVIVLPHYARTFDRRRAPTTVEHMWEDFRNGVGEDDLTHVEETFAGHKLNGNVTSEEEFRAHLRDNFQHRMMHHHVFEEQNSRALMESVGFRVLALETQLPYHLYLIVQIP